MATTEQLVTSYTSRYNRLRRATAAAVAEIWDRHAGPDAAQAERFAGDAAAIVLAAQEQVTTAVDGYVATVAQATPLGITAAYPRPVDPLEVYVRPIVTVRAALAAGRPFVEAMAAGKARAVNTAETDVALSQRQATAEVVELQPAVVGYRRTLTGRSCAFCATASTQRYHSADLLPLHTHCQCGVAPIVEGTRPAGQVINRQLLSDLKATARDGGRPDYWNAKHFTVTEDGEIKFPEVAVHDHGELGPTLADAAHDFTGPSAVPDAA